MKGTYKNNKTKNNKNSTATTTTTNLIFFLRNSVMMSQGTSLTNSVCLFVTLSVFGK